MKLMVPKKKPQDARIKNIPSSLEVVNCWGAKGELLQGLDSALEAALGARSCRASLVAQREAQPYLGMGGLGRGAAS